MFVYNASLWKWEGDLKGSVINNCSFRIEKGIFADVMYSDSSKLPQDGEISINANGRLVIPGLIDSHIHTSMLGESLYFLDLKDCPSIHEMKEKIHIHLLSHPKLKSIIGINWDQSNLSRYPCAQDLDEVCSDRPVWIWRACWSLFCFIQPFLIMYLSACFSVVY